MLLQDLNKNAPVLLALSLLLSLLLSACGGTGEDQGTQLVEPPSGHYLSVLTGEFDLLPNTDGSRAIIFKDRSRPRLSVQFPDNYTFTASGSQTNAAAREIVEYSLSGTWTSTLLSGTLRIVKKRSDTKQVFSTETRQFGALKQRHDTF